MFAGSPSPEFWMDFSYRKSSKESPFLKRIVWTFINCSIVQHSSDHDVVERIAKESGVPIESLSEELSQKVYPRSQVVHGFAGDEIEKITNNYDKMRWWISATGLNVRVLASAESDSDRLARGVTEALNTTWAEATRSRRAKQPRRNTKYEGIDKALAEIAEARPKNHEEVFQFLEDRKVPIPNRKPFKPAGGWLKGFRQNQHAASAWLSQVWARLDLPAFARGPKR